MKLPYRKKLEINIVVDRVEASCLCLEPFKSKVITCTLCKNQVTTVGYKAQNVKGTFCRKCVEVVNREFGTESETVIIVKGE